MGINSLKKWEVVPIYRFINHNPTGVNHEKH
jgi:hypothetical protein